MASRTKQLILSGVVAITLLAAAIPVASARTNPPTIKAAIDAGALMIQPWGQPPAGSDFNGLWTSNRDCGFSTPLSNGRIMWVFCDTALFDQNAVLRTNFVASSAAIASVSSSLVMRDSLPGGIVVPFIDPPDFYPCDGYRAAWPSSIATLPDSDGNANTDRVLVFFQNDCVHWGDNGSWRLDAFDIGVAVYEYDAATQPQAMKATVLNPRLFPATPGLNHQHGGAIGYDGESGRVYVHVYACADAGSCSVKRVLVTNDAAADRARVATAAAYEAWSGSAWSASATPAALFTPDPAAPVATAAASVQYVPSLGRYVMAYSPVPAFGAQAVIRTAPLPQGPWSEAVFVDLPGCATSQHCYAPIVQPRFASADKLALSYLRWDDFVGRTDTTATWYGRLHVTTFPFTTPRTASVNHNDIAMHFEIQAGALAFSFEWGGDLQPWYPIDPAQRWRGTPAAAVNPDRTLEVFAVNDANGLVYHARQQADGAFPAMTLLSGTVVSNGELAAAVNADGRLEVFAADAAGVVYRLAQTTPGTWAPSATAAFAAVYPSTAFRSPNGLAAATNADGRIELFAVDAAGQVFHTGQNQANGTTGWSPYGFWPLVDGSSFRASRGIAAVTNLDGRIEVFATDGWGQVLHTWQASPNGITGTSPLGFWPLAPPGSTTGGISAVRTGDGRVQVVAVAPDRVQERTSIQSTPGAPLTMTPLEPLD